MAIIITRRAKQHIRGLYLRSNRENINIRNEVRSLVDALEELVLNNRIKPSSNRNGVLSNWARQGYTIIETDSTFTRKSYGIKRNPILNKRQKARKWYFACVIDVNNLYIADAVFCKYVDRNTLTLPLATRFMSAMKGKITIQKKRQADVLQQRIQFPSEAISHHISQIITEVINSFFQRECK